MSDRTNILTVVLEKEMRLDDADSIMSAIAMIKGVSSVSPNVSDPTEHMAIIRAKTDLGKHILRALSFEQATRQTGKE